MDASDVTWKPAAINTDDLLYAEISTPTERHVLYPTADEPAESNLVITFGPDGIASIAIV